MNLKSNGAKAIKNFARNRLCSQKRGADRRCRRQAAFGAAAMEATALFGNLSRCCDGMKMERQKKNEQQDSRTHKAPECVRMLQARVKHGVEPRRGAFRCQWETTAIDWITHRFTLKRWVSLTLVLQISPARPSRRRTYWLGRLARCRKAEPGGRDGVPATVSCRSSDQ